MDKISFYLDEGVNIAVAAGLVRRGVEAKTVRDAGSSGLSDVEQIEYAIQRGMVIVTHDDDFISLAAKREHAGVVYVHQSKYSVGELVRMLKLLWDVLDSNDMKIHLEFL